MLPAPRTFQAGERTLIVRLNMGNILTATRRHRAFLAEFGITNIIGAGSELFMASTMGAGPLSAIEADAIFATAVLAENNPAISIEEYVGLVEEFPELAKAVEEEATDFIRPRASMMKGYLAVWEQTLVAALATLAGIDREKVRQMIAVVEQTGGPGSDPSPSLTSVSLTTNSGDQPSGT